MVGGATGYVGGTLMESSQRPPWYGEEGARDAPLRMARRERMLLGSGESAGMLAGGEAV